MASERVLDLHVPLFLFALALAGAYSGSLPLVTAAATLLFTLLATRAWSRHCLRSVRYERKLSDERAFPGDELEMSLRLTNDKLLPLPWVEVDDRVPPQLPLLSELGEPVAEVQDGRLRLAGSASWHERVTWRYRLRCRRRGIYRLGPAVVTSGDPFGFFPRSARAAAGQRVVVYPRLIPLDELRLPSGSPLGDVRAMRRLFEEPTRVVGLRDYRPEDPFRRIHWKATARRQELQVKIYEPTVELATAVVLAVDSFPQAPDPDAGEGPDVEPFERAVSLAASLCHLLIGRGVPVGLYANWGGAPSGGSLQLPPAGSQEQLLYILESLAGIECAATCPLEEFLSGVAPGLPWGSTVVLIGGDQGERLRAAAQSYLGAGRTVVVLPVTDSPSPEGEGGALVAGTAALAGGGWPGSGRET